MAESLNSLVDALDHHLARHAEVRRRDQELTRFVEKDLAALREKLLDGGSTSIPLRDWAILAHEDQYQEFMKTAMLIHPYLLIHAHTPAPSLVAVYVEWSETKSSVCYTLQVGFLADDGMRIAPVGQSLQIQVPCSKLYQEQGDIKMHDHQEERIIGMVETYQGHIVLDNIITPALCLDVDQRYFSSRTETVPHLTTRIQAGTDAVRQYLHEFWKGHEPREATEFFRSITPQASAPLR